MTHAPRAACSPKRGASIARLVARATDVAGLRALSSFALVAVITSCAPEPPPPEDWRAAVHGAITTPDADAEEAAPREAIHAPLAREVIHAPLALEGLPSGLHDVNGREIPIACETCHGARGLEVPAPRPTDEPDAPHAGFRFDHGERPCTACHDPDDRSRLRLADGTSLPMRDALALCAQCHGPQHRAFLHGAHGGMRGHWDATRGPRLRNHCVDCHDPHAPAIPRVAPMAAPRDRFRPASGDHARPSHGSAAAPSRADDAQGESPHD